MLSQIQKVMPQVKNIVFLMFENRSFDNLLGWLYENHSPKHVIPAGSVRKYGSYDGLQTGTYSNPYSDGTYLNVTKLPGGLGQYWDQMPFYDPTEQLRVTATWSGVMNQLFGNQNIITQLPAAPTPAGMQGFLQDYYEWEYMRHYKGADILWTYTQSDLPAINSLAGVYAVSDRWFCSVPSNTNPNRAYSLCGTSLGIESDEFNPYQQFEAPTIFNVLAAAGKSLGLYYSEGNWINGRCYTEYTFPWIADIPQKLVVPKAPVPNGNIQINDMSTFYLRAAAGTLPDFTYLEPAWGYSATGEWFTQGTDYHPPTHMAPGEAFLLEVWKAVCKGPQWKETLLIVTFDEHGGTYDHVAPPWSATNPDGRNGWSGFAFNLFGVRVPTILISPFVKSSTVFREPEGAANPDGLPFDHTSFIKTILMWAGVDPNSAGLGNRMPLAPTFDHVLESEQVNFAEFVPAAPKTESVPPAPLGTPGQPLNALFEGIPFVVTKQILKSNKDFPQIEAEVERYRENPAKFMLELREKQRKR